MRLLKRFAIGFILAVSICCFLVLRLYLNLPSHTQIKESMKLENLEVSSQVFDRTGQWIGKFSIKNRYLVSFDDLPNHLVFSFTSAEDKEFFTHFGINLFAIARAFYVNLKRGKVVQGASTITQQLAKSFFLTNERTINRKIKEALLAFKIESIFTKKTILEIYLNKIFLGNHAYGVGAAAKAYFNKNIQDLNTGESALLAALPKAPSFFAPHKHYDRAIKRQRKILSRMHNNGHISQEDLTYWLTNSPTIAVPNAQSKKFGYFLDMVKSEVFKKFSFDKNKVNGLNIYTSIDARFQNEVGKRLKNLNLNLRRYSKLSNPGIELAFVSLDHTSGEIVAISGGGKYAQTQYNRALFTRRPIGELIVPLALLYPLELGYQLNTPISPGGQTALSILLSTKASNLKVLNQLVGLGSLKEFLFKLGLPVIENRSLQSLERLRVSPMQLASAYASVFNGGKKISPFAIKGIESLLEYPIYKKRSSQNPLLIKKESAFIMSYALEILATIENSDLQKNRKGYYTISSNLRNAWIVASKGSLTHILWLGGEYGKSKIAANRRKAKNLLHNVIDVIFDAQGSHYQVMRSRNKDLRISFGRYSYGGRSLTIPLMHF